MKKNLYPLYVTIFLLSITFSGQAQSLKKLINSKVAKEVVNKVVNTDSLTFKSLEGNWTYEKPACSLESNNLLKDIGGKVVSEELEKKVAQMIEKAGITSGEFSIVFNSDSTFTNTIAKKELNGKYNFDPKTRILTMTYAVVGNEVPVTSVEAKVQKSGENIAILFNATKWKDYLKTITSVTNLNSLNTISSLLDGYDGVGVGYELKKQK